MARTSGNRVGRNSPISPNGRLERLSGERTRAWMAYHPCVDINFFQLAETLVREGERWSLVERVSATVRPLVGLGLVLVIYGVVRRNPWPRPFPLRFALLHVVVSIAISSSWIVISRLIEAMVLGWGQTVPYEREFFLIGSVAYLIVAGISYAVESTARAARAEAVAASTQLAALRSQLHPHFLFNALHTVVQLIPVNPALAMEAAELVADLLRSSLEEQRDEVPLADEWRFVSRYLAVERIRFGERLVVHEGLPSDLFGAHVPAFALQTLVENAVRHGAAPRVAATEITITASRNGSSLVLVVQNSIDADLQNAAAGIGTGLSRLRERLAVLYGNSATLSTGPTAGSYEAVLTIPTAR
ncbi:MAG: histidine kinase [Gemmatimonadaceae bacterium]|nr:histidine kinase [Gemmatimonadaceae bacterium]